jgi:hypothetical protein
MHLWLKFLNNLVLCSLSALALYTGAAALDRNNGLEAALQDSHAACNARDKELQEALAQLVGCLPLFSPPWC